MLEEADEMRWLKLGVCLVCLVFMAPLVAAEKMLGGLRSLWREIVVAIGEWKV